MNSDREYAYEQCYRRVMHYYVPSEMPGLRCQTEKLVALTIAWEADAAGLLPPLDVAYLATRARLSARTFRRYLSALFNTQWLVEETFEGETRTRIDPLWLKSLPPAPAPGTGG